MAGPHSHEGHTHAHAHAHHPAGDPEFSGFKGRVAAWFLTSPLRRVLEWRMGRPDGRIVALLQLNGHEQVLDMGCGSGFHSLMVARQLPQGQVIAVDVSTEMLDQLRRGARAEGLESRLRILQADGLHLPLEDSSVDRAVSAAVWHHLDDPDQAARELVRALRPGGRVVVSDLRIDPADPAVRGIHGHDRPFGPADMARILAATGLVDVQVEEIGRWVLGAGRKPAAPQGP